MKLADLLTLAFLAICLICARYFQKKGQLLLSMVFYFSVCIFATLKFFDIL